MKKKSLAKQYWEMRNSLYILRYEIEGDKIKVFYSDGSITTLLNTKENEIEIIHSMRKQAEKLEALINRFKDKENFWDTLSWVSLTSLIAHEANNEFGPNPSAERAALNIAFCGSAIFLTSYLRNTNGSYRYELQKMQYFIDNERDINSDFIPNQLEFDQRGLPINGYRPMRLDQVGNTSYSYLKQRADKNREQEYQLKRKAC